MTEPRALSQSEACLEESFPQPERVADAVVIGSGYGGAVAAYRLAAQGLGVAVLERGEEWHSGEFPDGLGKAFGQVRMRMPGNPKIQGNPQGLFEVRAGKGLAALVGNALGGTSQINANLLRKPDAGTFQRQHHASQAFLWPAPLREVGALDVYYDRARDMLGAQSLDEVFHGSRLNDQGVRQLNPWSEPLKHKALKKLQNALAKAGVAARMDRTEWLTVRANKPDAALDEKGRGDPIEGQCAACGECVAGCNFNAKLTLTHSYLVRARQAGAYLYTGAAVQWLKKLPDGDWEVAYVPSGAERDYEQGVDVPIKHVRAKRVVLAAGTFGSTEILFRSQDRDGSELRFSRHLGQRLSTNGDNLAAIHLTPDEVNGVGVGAAGVARDGQAVGPTITGCIQIGSEQLEQRFLIQDAAVPRALAGFYHELLASFGAWAQWTSVPSLRFGLGTPRPPHDWASLHPGSLSHTQLLLLVGHDRSGGRMSFDRKAGLTIAYDTRELAQVGGHQMAVLSRGVAKDDGWLLENPLLRPVPRQLGALPGPDEQAFSGVTVHPLGGCCMGDNVNTGVVDHMGRVFDPEAAEPKGVHEGLYVLDGSIVPGSLGANPLWTITALAERACDHWGLRLPDARAVAAELPLPFMRDKKTLASARRQVPVRFTEVLRAPKFHYQPDPSAPLDATDEAKHQARLLLHMPLPSLEAFAADPGHAVVLGTPNLLPGREPGSFRIDDAATGQCVAELTVIGGTLHLLPVNSRRSVLRHVSEALRVVGTYWLTPPKASSPSSSSVLGFCRKIAIAWRMAESRLMSYRIQLRAPAGQGHGAREYVLIGTKQVGYAADWRALLRAVWDGEPPARRNVWDAFITLDAKLYRADGALIGEGALKMDLVDLARYYAPQLGMRGNTPDALVSLAGYASWMLRLLVATRFPDITPPDAVARVPRQWRDVPPAQPGFRRMWGRRLPQKASGSLLPYPPLRVRGTDGRIQLIPARGPYRFKVKRNREAAQADVELFLVHYPHAVTAEENRRCGPGVLQTNAMLMLNGFAQSTLSNVPEEFDGSQNEIGLAPFFHQQGMDVWMLEYRLSPVLEASRLRSSMDEIAEFDIPAAVELVLTRVRRKLPVEQRGAQLQIHTFAHCIGSGAMAMSILGGRLDYAGGKEPVSAVVSKLASVTFSQIHPYLVGSESAQMRLQLAALLQNAANIDYLNMSPADEPPGEDDPPEKARAPSAGLEALLDGLFASLPHPPGEQCPEERLRKPWGAATCTCKRMSGVISRVLKHDQLKRETHARLPEYFGRANTGILAHGGLCVERERLVNADGQNVYVTADRLAKYLNMPVALLHGRHNPLFSIESARETHRQLRGFVPDMPCEGHQLIEAPSFAHFDCTIGTGRAMRAEILAPLQVFLRNARRINRKPVQSSEPQVRYVVQPPLAGPVLGWSRPKDGGGRLLNVWIAVDEDRTTPAEYVMVVIGEEGKEEKQRVQICDVERIPVLAAKEGKPRTRKTLAVAVAQVHLTEADFKESDKPLRIAMASVHKIPEATLTSDQVRVQAKASSDARLPALPETPPDAPSDSAGARGSLRLDDSGRVPRRHFRPWRSAFSALAHLTRSPNESDVSQNLVESHMQARLQAVWRDPVLINFQQPAPLPSDGAGPVHPVISPQEANRGLLGLRRQQDSVRQTALRAVPPKLARRARNAYPLGGEEAGMAWVSKRLLEGAETSNLCFVAACCQHPGTPVEADRADASMLAIADGLDKGTIPAQFMCLVGDQIYADATAGLTDSLSPIERIRSATLRAFNAAGFRRVTTRLPTYMTLDDHEIENEWSLDRLKYQPDPLREQAQAQAERLRDAALAYARAYQWRHSPCDKGAAAAGPFDYSFEAIGSRFYTLDTRSQRRRFTEPQVCSASQLTALEAWLASVQNPGELHVITTGSVLAPGLHAFDTGGKVSHPGADTWQLAPQQRRQVLQAMAVSNARNIVLLSGDYHCSAVSVLRFFRQHPDKPREHFRTAYAIVVPPLYAPFPAINAHPKDLMEKETIELTKDCAVEIETKACYGQGYSVIQLEHLADGRRVLDVSMHLTLLDTGDAPRAKVERQRLPLTS